MFKKLFKNQKGFTLVEILVVIVIIGILFTVILPRIDFAGDKARQTGVKTDFRTFTVAAEQYFREGAGNNLTFDGFNSFLDEANKINATGLVGVTPAVKDSFKEDPWKKKYQVLVDDLDSTKGQVVFTSSGKKGGTLTTTTNTGDFTLAVYYRQGSIETCTTGFGDADIKLAAFTTYVPGGCGTKLTS